MALPLKLGAGASSDLILMVLIYRMFLFLSLCSIISVHKRMVEGMEVAMLNNEVYTRQ